MRTLSGVLVTLWLAILAITQQACDSASLDSGAGTSHEDRYPGVSGPSIGDFWQPSEPFESDVAKKRKITTKKPSFGVDHVVRPVPKSAQALHWPTLADPLLPLPRFQDDAEDEALASALEVLSAGDDWQAASALVLFAEAHVDTRWGAATALSLGELAHRSGRLSEALKWWYAAWERAKDDEGIQARRVANLAIAEYVHLTARIGRIDEVRRVLALVDERSFQGNAAIKLTLAREALQLMEDYPELAFLCGPLALQRVFDLLNPEQAKRSAEFISSVKSTTRGFTLTEVAEMAPQLGLDMAMVHRQAGSEIPVPAVVHWKVGHFGAILERDNDMYRVVDPVVGDEKWVSRAVIDAETSGYVMVQAAEAGRAGYRPVAVNEADRVSGRASCPMRDIEGISPNVGGDDEPCAMATYTFNAFLATLSVSDTPIRYEVARGPDVAFKVTYNQGEARQPVLMDFSNFGPSWVSSWVSYLEQHPTSLTATVHLRNRGGGGVTFTGFSSTDATSDLDAQTSSHLRRTGENTYVREYADGRKEYYEHYIGSGGVYRRVFLSRVADPAGNEVVLHYNSENPTRLDAIVDAVGLTTTLEYENTEHPYLVTAIEDPFGRRATFTYDEVAGQTQLVSIEDPIGIVSSFDYNEDDGMTSLTTPYGTTTFESNPFGYVEARDPNGNRERIQYHFRILPASALGPALGELAPDPDKVSVDFEDRAYRNSLYWSKQAMAGGELDKRKAHVYQWLTKPSARTIVGILASEVPVNEGRIWYNYAGQGAPNRVGPLAKPSVTARVVVDENGVQHTQASRFEYNGFGNLTRKIDPAGRETELIYAENGIDLIEVRQRVGSDAWETLRSLARDSSLPAHRPASITEGSGQTSTYTYNDQGQILTETDALGQVATYEYQTDPTQPGFGQLRAIVSEVARFRMNHTYDSFDRIRSTTSSEGRTVTFDYDALDRLRTKTYDDGTYEQFEYESQSLVARRDRQGRWTRHYENALRQRVLTRDPEGRTNQYSWCLCGEVEKIVDGNGNITQWHRDLAGRLVAVEQSDGTLREHEYDYSGRRVAVTDESGRTERFTYTIDGQLASLTYDDADTPNVYMTYDPYFARISARTDGQGLTSLSYVPYDGASFGAGKLLAMDGPLPDDTVKYRYDALGRAIETSIVDDATQSMASWHEQIEYDERGRRSKLYDNLGEFTYFYEGDSHRVARVDFPNGMVSEFEYEGVGGNFRLARIKNISADPSVTLSQFDHTYNPDETIGRWSRQLGDETTQWRFGYDKARQLTDALLFDDSGAMIKTLAYAYDGAGNRIHVGDDAGSRNYEVDELNQLMSKRGDGPTIFAGSVDEAAAVTVDGEAASVRSTDGVAPYVFRGLVDLVEGENDVVVQAVDGGGNSTTSTYRVQAEGVTTQYEYDRHGNLRFERDADGAVLTEYRWDQADRLVSLKQGLKETRFAYDGSSRRISIRELEDGVEQSHFALIWCGKRLCQIRNAAGDSIVRSYMVHGVEEQGTPYYFTRDHLSSIREVVASDGTTLQARYDYGIWGKASRIYGSGPDIAADFAGLLSHPTSGKYLASFRLYDPDTGRWISRDPVGMRGGVNLHAYAWGDPVNLVDPDGDTPIPVPFPIPNVGRMRPLAEGCGIFDDFKNRPPGGNGWYDCYCALCTEPGCWWFKVSPCPKSFTEWKWDHCRGWSARFCYKDEFWGPIEDEVTGEPKMGCVPRSDHPDPKDRCLGFGCASG